MFMKVGSSCLLLLCFFYQAKVARGDSLKRELSEGWTFNLGDQV
jgi:hypothetical protein